MAEDKKVVKLFLDGGFQVGVLTRMPMREIESELYDGLGEWITLEGLNTRDERVPFRSERSRLICAFVEPWHQPTPAQMQRPDNGLVMPRPQ